MCGWHSGVQLSFMRNLKHRHQFAHQMMLLSMLIAGGKAMRTTVTLEDDLIAEAQSFTGITEKSMLLREALKALIQREAAHRLVLLGGTEPDAAYVPRRRPPL
jgi:Arc/MetJ family transcription regulator